MKNNKGITLIALVVTIIVLLILATVSIAMLTGDNGILTNASKTSTENAYYSAEEQVKLAFMAVKTEIMAQVVKDGTYDARLDVAATGSGATATPAIENVKALAQIVKNDLNSSKWKVYYKGVASASTAAGTHGYIYITYADSAIDQGAMETGKPRYEGKVAYTIAVYKQDATIDPTTVPTGETADTLAGTDVEVDSSTVEASKWISSGKWLANWEFVDTNSDKISDVDATIKSLN